MKHPGCEFGSVDFHDKLSLMNIFQDTDIRKNIYSMSKKSIDIFISESYFFVKIGLFAYLTLLLQALRTFEMITITNYLVFKNFKINSNFVVVNKHKNQIYGEKNDQQSNVRK